jgi:hypothetical protein
MRLHRHRRFYPDNEVSARLESIVRQLDLVLKNQGIIMSTLADAQAAQAITDTKIAAIAADVQTLLGKITNIPGTLTPEQQAAIDDITAHAGRINDALSAVDTSANPAPAPQA